MEIPKTLQQAMQFFRDAENCRQFMISVRWLDGKVRCSHCDSEKVTYLEKAKLYRCYGDHPKQKFSLKVGTVFEDSPIPLDKWLPAVWLVVNCKNGISSYELHRAIGVTQKSAWFMLHRIRLAIQSKSFVKLGGPDSPPVEVDESFIGGKARNMHKSRKLKLHRLRNEIPDHKSVLSSRYLGKTVVLGMLERGGRARAKVVSDRRLSNVQSFVRENAEKGATLHTDEFDNYKHFADEYEHKIVNHLERYVDGQVHTQGMENFWSLLKRGLNGTYVAVEPFHLFRYVDEQLFRYNNRATRDDPLTDADRFHLAMTQVVGKRLTFAEVTGKEGTTPF
ncbi:MAG: IS1595 family transposase [Terriglobales bacterium]